MVSLAEQHAEEVGIELIVLDGQQAGQPSSTKQTADLEAMIVEGVNGVVISPNDVQALVPGIQAVLDADIPVVTVDRNVTGVRPWPMSAPTTSRAGACRGGT
jgi:ABC-type sugar transport system substrate-binding protein